MYVRLNLENFETAGDIHQYDTRSRNDLRIRFLRLNKSWNATLHFGPAFFNKLPKVVRELPVKKYKIVIRKYLLNKVFYNYNDFLNDDVTEQDFLLY